MVDIQLDLPESLIAKIQELQTSLNLQNPAEVISYAISFLDRIEEARKRGDKVVIKSSGYIYPPSGSTTTYTVKD
jgi:hypothetical protein